MSAYQFPQSGGLSLMFNNIQCGIFFNETPLGTVMVAAKYSPMDGWLAFWSHGPNQDTNWQAECDAVGGIINFIKTLVAAINAAFIKAFGGGPAPPPVGTVFSTDAGNAALAQGFTLSPGATAPVMGVK